MNLRPTVWRNGDRSTPGLCALFMIAWAFLLAPLWVQSGETNNTDFTTKSLDELMQVKIPTVVAASKHEQKVTEAPSSVSLVTREDIEQFGYRTLADILRSVRGVYVTSDEIYNYIGIRGVNRPGDYGGRVLVMVNGHRMNEPVYDQAFNGHDLPLDVDLIERVEVIRGTGSSLYGNNAGLGIINIVTREASSWDGIEGSISGATYETLTGRITYGKEFTNGMSLILSGTLYNSEGRENIYYPEYSAVNGGIAHNLDGEQAQKVFASLKYSELTLEAGFGNRNRDIPNAAYGMAFNSKPTYGIDQRGYIEGRHEHEFEGDWTSKTRLYYDYYQFEGLFPFPGALPTDPLVVNHDYARAQVLGAEFQLTKSFGEINHLTFGTEWNHQLEVRQINYDESPFVSYTDISSDGDLVGVYVQDEFKICDPLTLNAGVRYDWYSGWGDTINPRIAAIYSPWSQTTFKAIYGEAFRAPNYYESDYVAPGYLSNPSLQPENIQSGELVFEQGFAQHYRATLTAFQSRLTDLISQEQDPLGNLFYDNAGEITARGAEAEVEAQCPNGWRARASYSYVRTRDESTGMRLSNSPEHMGKLNVVAPLWTDKVSLGLELQALSERQTIDNNRVNGFIVCNLTLFSQELIRNLDCSISIYNLFDENYADPVSDEFLQTAISQPGRSLRVKVTYRF
jgi:outer membrane receptor for ferrienterochelin and colicins